VSKRFFSVSINQLRDGARFPTVWSKMWFHFTVWTKIS
jgi:hypothetical protein